jgi:hypothetical protein
MEIVMPRDESQDIVIARTAIEKVFRYSGQNVNVAPVGRARMKPETHRRFAPIEQLEELESKLQDQQNLKDPTP